MYKLNNSNILKKNYLYNQIFFFNYKIYKNKSIKTTLKSDKKGPVIKKIGSIIIR